jgi:tetratricopeptide (TPR) repeat protein
MRSRRPSWPGFGTAFICLSLTVGLLEVKAPQHSFSYSNKARDEAIEKMHARDFNSALVDLEKAIGSYANDPENYMLRGKCYFHLANYEQSIYDFNKVLELSPNFFAAFLWRGSAHAKLGHDDLAIKDFEQAIRLNPRLAKRYFDSPGLKNKRRQSKAVVAAERFHLPGVTAESYDSPAVHDYEAAIKRVYPDGYSASAPERVGSANPGTYATDAEDETYLTEMAAGAETGASDDSRQQKHSHGSSRNEEPRNHDTQTAHAERESGRKKHTAGKSDRGKYQALADRSAGATSTNIEGNLDIGRSDDTLTAKKDKRVVPLLDQDPDFGEFGKVPGSHPLKGDAETVVKRCTEAIQQDDRNAEYFYLRAKAFQKLARVNDAYRDFSRAISIDPNVAKYYIGRASMFYQLNKPLLVDADVKRAQGINQELPHIIHFGGDLYPSTVKWSGP